MIKDKTNILERLALMAWNHDGEENKTLMDAISIICNQQKIVCCKDCKYRYTEKCICETVGDLNNSDSDVWFCADGEVKE